MWIWPEREPADKNLIEETAKRMQHDPAQWAAGMVKAALVLGTVAVLLLVWVLVSTGRGA